MKKWLLSMFLICNFFVLNANAELFMFWRYREHATDCTSLTDGRERDLCKELDDDTMFYCEPTVAGELCDTPAEWKSIVGSGSGDMLKSVYDTDNDTYIDLNNGALDVDLSGYTGLVGVNSTAQEIDTKAELESMLSDVNNFAMADGDTYTGSHDFSGATLTGNASTASSLAANGANCSSGQSPLGVDTAGAVESCFDVWTEAENTAAGYISGNQTITLSGEVSGSGTTSISVTIDNNALDDQYYDSESDLTTLLDDNYESKTSNDIDPDRLNGDTVDNNLIDPSIVNGVKDADYGDITVSSGAWAVEDDSHNHVITNIDSFTKSELETQVSDVTDFAMADGDIFTGDYTFNTGNIDIDDTTTSTSGVITKNTVPFIHNFHHPTGDTAIPEGFNIFLGEGAGNFTMGSTATNTYEASNNIGIGKYVFNSNTTGHSNVAIGGNNFMYNTTGYSNVSLGFYALGSNTTGFFNMAIGNSSLQMNQTGGYNCAVGTDTLKNSTGSYNVGIGTGALGGLNNGNLNSAFGLNAGRYIDSGSELTTSNDSIFIGYNSKAKADNSSNEIVIGTNAVGIGSNSVTLGNDSITKTALKGNIGVGTSNPSSTLDVVGSLEIPHSAIPEQTVEGQIAYDTTITGLTSGAIIYYDGSGTNYLVDLDTIPTNDDYVVAYDADADKFYMKVDSTGSGGGGNSIYFTENDIPLADNVSADINWDAVNSISLQASGQRVYADINWVYINDNNLIQADYVNWDSLNDSIQDYAINWGSGINQVSASDMPNEDVGDITITSGVWAVEDDSHNHVITNIDSFTKSNLEAQVSDVADFAEADGDTYSNTHDFSNATIALPASVISSRTDVTSADEDYMIIWDATDSALKKVDMAEVRGGNDGTGTDDQTIDVFSISGNNLQLSLESDGEATKTVDISTISAVAANTSKVTDDDLGVDEVYGSGWNGDPDSPEKDDVYDYLHVIDSDDDGSLIDETWFDLDNIGGTTSAGLRGLLSDESGTGAAIFAAGDIGSGTATTPSADDNDTSIATTAYVQGEINGSGGRSLTCSSGSCDADSELYTYSIADKNLELPTTSDDGVFNFSMSVNSTVTKVICSTDTGSATINFEERALATPGTSGTDILSADIVCDTDSQTSCSSGCDVNTISNASLDATDPVALMISATSGDPNVVRFLIIGTKDE